MSIEEEERNPKKQYTLTVWTYGTAFHTALVAGAGKAFARKEQSLMALDCKLEMRLGNMWVKTGVEQMLGWIDRNLAIRCPFRTHVCVEGDVGEACSKFQKTVLHSDMSQLILVGQMWRRESSLKKTGRATWQLMRKQKRERKKVSYNNR